MTPAQDVGGDFYDVFHLPEQRLGIVMADVSGKGVPAALFMMVSRTLVKGNAVSALSPGEALTQVNNLLGEENERAMFVTLLFGIFDTTAGSFTYANAGHCAPYLVRSGEKPREMPSTQGIALGVVPDFPYSEASVRLDPEDRIFLYTDGVPEAEAPDKELFENHRLEDILKSVAEKSPEEINRAVLDAVREFSGGEHQSDDITCLTLRRGES
jgi:sigma-B regulation protein RsbU (phosphoserine phosphatase)